MIMKMVNIYEAKAKLSEYLDAALKGERVVICKHNQPIAELRPIDQVRSAARDLTPLYPGETFVTAGFFDPLSDDEIAAWEGTDPRGRTVAEQHGTYSTRTGRHRKRKARR